MLSLFDDVSVPRRQDIVGVLNGGEAAGGHKAGFILSRRSRSPAEAARLAPAGFRRGLSANERGKSRSPYECAGGKPSGEDSSNAKCKTQKCVYNGDACFSRGKKVGGLKRKRRKGGEASADAGFEEQHRVRPGKTALPGDFGEKANQNRTREVDQKRCAREIRFSREREQADQVTERRPHKSPEPNENAACHIGFLPSSGNVPEAVLIKKRRDGVPVNFKTAVLRSVRIGFVQYWRFWQTERAPKAGILMTEAATCGDGREGQRFAGLLPKDFAEARPRFERFYAGNNRSSSFVSFIDILHF